MPRRLWAILAVAFGVSLSVIDSAIANVALPTIGLELGISAADSIWIVNAYQLAIMVSLLSFSALGDVVGYRKVYIGGLMLFTVASVGCALSTSLPTLVLARVMQGFGAAAVTSVNTTLIRIIYPKAQLGRGMGINATVVAVSSVAGPTLAAGILSVAQWPWLFAVNIPIGLVALWLSRRFLPDNPVRVSARRFDWRDAVMNALTFGLLMASVEGFSHGLDPRLLTLGIAALLIVGFFFIRSQLREPYPILPFDLLRISIFSVSVVTSICSFLGQMLAMVALPFYLQHEFGYDEVATGLLMTAWPAVIMVVAPVAGMLVERIHAGLLGGTGLTAMAAGLFLLAFLPEHPAPGDIVWRLVLCGAGFGLFQSPNNSILSTSLPTLVLARVMQGFGAAAVTSVNTTLIRIIYPKAQLGRGMGINATVVAVSSVAGPTLAAGILSVAQWPWLFAVNIPIGLVALWLSRRFLPDNPVRVSARRFDWRDAVMNALTFGLLMASVEGFSHGLDPRLLTLGIAALLIVGFFFIRSQLREPYPILPFDLLRISIFSVSVVTSICSFLGQMLAMVALPFYLQHEFGYDEVATGLLMTAWPAVIMVVAPVAGMLVERIHAGLLGGTGLTAMAAGLFLLAFLPEHPAPGDIVWRLVLCGAGFGLFQSPNNSILIASAPPERSGSASGMLATARLIGQTTGAALMALLFHIVPDDSTHTALLLAGGFAFTGAVVSLTRIRLPLPEGLARQKK